MLKRSRQVAVLHQLDAKGEPWHIVYAVKEEVIHTYCGRSFPVQEKHPKFSATEVQALKYGCLECVAQSGIVKREKVDDSGKAVVELGKT